MNAPLCGRCRRRPGDLVAAYQWLCWRCRTALGIPENPAGKEPLYIVAAGGRERFRTRVYARALAVCDRLHRHGQAAGIHLAYE